MDHREPPHLEYEQHLPLQKPPISISSLIAWIVIGAVLTLFWSGFSLRVVSVIGSNLNLSHLQALLACCAMWSAIVWVGNRLEQDRFLSSQRRGKIIGIWIGTIIGYVTVIATDLLNP